jgi:hypothetical protein
MRSIGRILVAALVPALALAARGDDDPAQDGGVGTAHRIHFVAAHPDGAWVVIAQAREDTDGDGTVRVGRGPHAEFTGDVTRTYLVRGSGAGEPIDAYVASSPSGRHVAFIRDGRLVLLDVAEGTEVNLSARGADADTRGFHRADRVASFDRVGRHVAYVRREGDLRRVVVRSLEGTGTEVEINPGSGLLDGADLTADGEWVVVRVVTRDSDRDGVLRLPHGAPSPASHPGAPFSRQGVLGDGTELRLARATGGAVEPLPSPFCVMGRRRVVRGRDWSLALAHSDGASTPLAGAEAGAIVHSYNPILEAVVVVHTAGEAKGRVEWIRGSARRVLPVAVASFPVETPRMDVRRFEALELGFAQRGSVIDYETGNVDVSPDHVMAVHGPIVLRARDRALVLRNVESGEERILGDLPRSEYPFARTAGSLYASMEVVVDLAQMKVLGSPPVHPTLDPTEASPQAVRRDGRVLVARDMLRDGRSRHPRGPYFWLAPVP